jgi:hypothetical protein
MTKCIRMPHPPGGASGSELPHRVRCPLSCYDIGENAEVSFSYKSQPYGSPRTSLQLPGNAVHYKISDQQLARPNENIAGRIAVDNVLEVHS